MRYSSYSDNNLVQLANDGHTGALEALYLRHRDWVVSVAYRYTANYDDALDVLQETFTYFFRKFPCFTLRAKLRTFLYPVIKNTSFTIKRRKKTSVPFETVAEVLPTGDSSSPDASPQLVRSELTDLLSMLNDDEREVVLLRFVDDCTLGDIAGMLQIPLGTVKSRLHNSLKKLRADEKIKKYFER